jgi:hypothetical protein
MTSLNVMATSPQNAPPRTIRINSFPIAAGGGNIKALTALFNDA